MFVFITVLRSKHLGRLLVALILQPRVVKQRLKRKKRPNQDDVI